MPRPDIDYIRAQCDRATNVEHITGVTLANHQLRELLAYIAKLEAVAQATKVLVEAYACDGCCHFDREARFAVEVALAALEEQ